MGPATSKHHTPEAPHRTQQGAAAPFIMFEDVHVALTVLADQQQGFQTRHIGWLAAAHVSAAVQPPANHT